MIFLALTRRCKRSLRVSARLCRSVMLGKLICVSEFSSVENRFGIDAQEDWFSTLGSGPRIYDFWLVDFGLQNA